MNINNITGTILREERNKASISQEELAHLSGLDRTYISMLERGIRKPTLNTLFSMCSALGIYPSSFIKEVENRSNYKPN